MRSLGIHLSEDAAVNVTSLLVVKAAARVRRAAYVDRGVSFLNKSDLALLVDDETGAIADSPVRHQYAVIGRSLACNEIAEERKRQGKLLCKFTKGGDIIRADSENLRISSVKFRDTSLVSSEVLRSTTGERGGEEGDYDVLAATKVGELDLLAARGVQIEIGRHVTNLEVSFWRRRGLCQHCHCHCR
jgi:hypothetical protein